VRSGTVFILGEGGVGVFAGVGGNFGCAGSMNEYSEVLSESCSLDSESDDSDADQDSEEVDGLLIGVIVPARERETKHPCARG
jgi:hypothetical protein